MSFDKFYFRNFGRHLFQRYFRWNIAISKTSFWARPLKIEHAKLIVMFDLCSKKTLSCVWCHASDRVCFTANTHMTNFSFQVLVRRRSLFSIFLDSTSIFLFAWLGTHLFGRTLTRSHKLFFLPMDYFFGCVLEETHGTTFLEARGDCKMQAGNLKLTCT